MASSKEDGIAAAAADQLASTSLDESGEKKVVESSETDEDAEENEAPAKLCSACETKSDALMKCRACKCVWYCDKKCQNKHWKEHKRDCKRIKKELDKRGGKLDVGTEMDVGPLPDVPPREECPICMRALPLHQGLQGYYACCGKSICGGCNFQHQMKSQERPLTCAFCRTAVPESDEELLARLHKRVELRDPDALVHMAMHYGEGGLGLPVDQAKCIDLLRQSSDLGFPGAQHALGCYYTNGEMVLEQDEEEALKYWKKAAEGGHLISLHNLGCEEDGRGDDVAAMRHWRLSASEGLRDSMTNLIICFEDGFLHHADLAESLQTFYRARAEMKSEGRDQYIKHLKKTGEYKEHHDY